MPKDTADSPSTPTSAAGPDLAFLARLARRNTVIVVETVAGDGIESRLIGRWQTVAAAQSEVEPSRDTAIAPEILAAALAAGFIAPLGDARSLGLSAKGRAYLRRLRALKLAERVAEDAGARPDAAEKVALNPAESPLAWLRRRLDRQGNPLIGMEQFEAGERLRADLWRAGLTPRVTQSWSGIPRSSRGARPSSLGSAAMTDARVAAGQRVNRALAAVGPEFANLLFDVCGHLRGLEEIEAAEAWPQRSAKVMLQTALNALARHYGLLPSVDVAASLRGRLRHWGTPGYRPSLERWR